MPEFTIAELYLLKNCIASSIGTLINQPVCVLLSEDFLACDEAYIERNKQITNLATLMQKISEKIVKQSMAESQKQNSDKE